MSTLTLLSFPSFNLYSTPLLLLIIQGYIFALLLLVRFGRKRNVADLLLALLLLITGYHCTSYTIGYMSWYDTFRNTKINYFLVPFALSMGPLVYLYVRSLTQPLQGFKSFDLLHFVPMLVYLIYRIFAYWYDASQPGFELVQNGPWMRYVDFKYIGPPVSFLQSTSQFIYLTISIRLFQRYQQSLSQNFSNTVRLELNWIRYFLVIYTGLFVFGLVISILGNFISLSWSQGWWLFFFSAVVINLVGIKSYFTDLEKLYQYHGKEAFVPVEPKAEAISHPQSQLDVDTAKQALLAFMEAEKPYLNPALTLTDLARQYEMGTNQLSQIINLGFGQNFNEFINHYRIEAVKQQLQQGAQKQLSLLGVALECGFNSKATFNRTFKKLTQTTPSQYAASLNI